MVGDSLEVGSGPYLRGALAGVPLELDAKRSRSSSEGLRRARLEAGAGARGRGLPAGDQRLQRGHVRIEPGRRSGAGRTALHGGGHDRAPQPARLLDRRSQPRGGAVRGDRKRPGGGLALGRAVHTRRARARSHPRDGTGVCPASKPAGGGGAGLPAGREPGRHTRAGGSEHEGPRRAVGAPPRAPAKAPAPAARQAAGEGGDPGPRRCGRSHRVARGLGAGRGANSGNEELGPSPCWGRRRTDLAIGRALRARRPGGAWPGARPAPPSPAAVRRSRPCGSGRAALSVP